MAPIIDQICQKLIAQGASQITPGDAPPPYSTSGSPASNNIDIDNEEEDEDNDEDGSSPNVTLTIDASHNIRGSNNVVPTAATTYSIASKLSDALLVSLQRINDAQRPQQGSEASSPSHNMKVNLTINCSITIIGDRNVVGNIPHIGLKQKPVVEPVVAGPSDVRKAEAVNHGDGAAAVQIGAKRKAVEDGDEVPNAKRVATRD